LLHLAGPSFDVGGSRPSLVLSEIVQNERRIFGVAAVARQFVLRDAHGRASFLFDPSGGNYETQSSGLLRFLRTHDRKHGTHECKE